MPVLKTKRLILRPLSVSDQDDMVDRIMSDTDVMHWLPGSDETSTLKASIRWRSALLGILPVFGKSSVSASGRCVLEAMNWVLRVRLPGIAGFFDGVFKSGNEKENYFAGNVTTAFVP